MWRRGSCSAVDEVAQEKHGSGSTNNKKKGERSPTPRDSPPRSRRDRSGDEDKNPLLRRRIVWIVAGLILLAILVVNILQNTIGVVPLPYSELKTKIGAGHVERVVLSDVEVRATPTEEARQEVREQAADEGGDRSFNAWSAPRVRSDEGLVPLLEAQGVEYTAQISSGCEGSMLWFWMLPLVLLFVFWSVVTRRMASMNPNSPAMSFGKSRAKVVPEEGTGVTFQDVAGLDEAKEELLEVVDFLRYPEQITRLGGKAPKGVLLVGPPGTGKTLMARAMAGEAGVPFFSLSGSDFVEMFVGVGAARVRDLFKQAEESAPCIIFVDELDAIGKSRSAPSYQGNDEREQTLNALLVEMDGFDSRSGVILIGATNRPEVLDQALLRPGRFDRQVVVDRPDINGREQILQVHARGIILAEDLDLRLVAAQTPGFVGADLANVVNEAALLAARKGKDAVEMSDFQDAIERVVAGLEKKSRRLNDKEFNIVAFHEAGHAIVAAAVEHADPVHKVSIISRGIAALGYTLQIPLEDRYLQTRAELRDRIMVLLGGRAAEQIVLGDVSTGASNDLQRVTDICRRMIIDFGMSDRLGNVSYGDRQSAFLTPLGVGARPYSEETAVAIDQETQELVSSLYLQTLAILRKNIDLLHEMSEALKVKEVLEGAGLAALLERVEPPDAPPRAPSTSTPNVDGEP